ncbi:hypothetical protein JG663_18425, partial [Vibrio cholerae]
QVDEAKEKSKKARRQAQRRKEHEKNLIQNKTLAAQKVAPSSSEKLNGLIEGDIEIFGDIA